MVMVLSVSCIILFVNVRRAPAPPALLGDTLDLRARWMGERGDIARAYIYICGAKVHVDSALVDAVIQARKNSVLRTLLVREYNDDVLERLLESPRALAVVAGRCLLGGA